MHGRGMRRNDDGPNPREGPRVRIPLTPPGSRSLGGVCPRRAVDQGSRVAISVGGVLTGRGADIIVIDDPLKPEEALSQAQRQAANEWFDHTLYGRLNDKLRGAIVLIMHRLHEDDLAGHVLAAPTTRRIPSRRISMSIEAPKEKLPEYARDQRLNLAALVMDTLLSEQQRWGTLVATALASRNPKVIAAIVGEAKEHLSPEALEAAKAAASIMAMNNIYFRFVHMAGDADYKSMPARLRMSVIAQPGVDKSDFELWSLAVSAINGCGACIEAHDHALKHAGVSKEAVQQAVRIASVVHAVAATLDGEQALAA